MIKRALIGLTLASALVLLPAAAQAASDPSPSTSTSTSTTPAALGPARDASWKVKGDHRATLSWKAPANLGDRKVRYVVIVRIKLGSAKATTRTESAYAKTSITYNSIPAGAKLTGEVTVTTRYAADKHDSVPAFTQPQLRPSQVRDARLIATGAQLQATWNPPKNDAGTLFNGYRVTLYKVPQVSSEKLVAIATANLNAGERKRIFKGLEGQSQYYAFIQAKNSEGLGQKTQTNVATTGASFSEPSETPTSTAPSSTPTATPSATSSATPGIVVPSQVTPTAAAPTPMSTEGVQTTGLGAISPDAVKLLVAGGVVLLLAILALVGWRLYRRYA